jgi:4-amino-4-deoxy-L-arabinose transferase-like glycosyltransferase
MRDGPPAFPFLKRWAPASALLGLWVFHAANNWIWLSKNVTTRGWDRMNALVNSLLYNATLSHLSLQTLFKASIQDEVRPPLFGTSMALMYKFLGVSRDTAVMANLVYLGILLVASYGIGKKLGGRRLGLLAAALTVSMPLLFSMSRYSYFEFALTALVVLGIDLLLASDRFQNRRNSLLLGVVLGMGVLLKRTYPIFVIGPLLVVVLQAGLIQKLWARLRMRPRVSWRAVVLALAGGLSLAALWVLPNRDLAQTLPAGRWLLPVWATLAAITIYFLLLPPSVEANALAGGSLVVSTVSIWYLPHSNFVQRALRAGWGVNDPRGRTTSLLNPTTYAAYLGSIVPGVSLVYVVLLLVLAVVLVFYLLRRRPRIDRAAILDSSWWVAVAALVVPYVILSTSIYHETRAITPLLPLVALFLAAALLTVPWRRLRIPLIAVTLLFGLVQFLAVSYTETHALAEATRFPVRVLGQAGLFAEGAYVELPDSGGNDPGFWIADDVLPRVETTRQARGWDTISLGVMAGSDYLHAGMFAYDQILRYPAIQLENPLQSYPADSPYSIAFRYDYLVVLENHNRGKTMQEGARLILDERRAYFDQAFELEAQYPLPDGDNAYLFRRQTRPAASYDGGAAYEAARYVQEQATENDLVVVASPGLLAGFLESYWGPAPVVTLARPGTLPEGPGTLPQALAAVPEAGSQAFVLTAQDAGSETEEPLAGWRPAEVLQLGPVQVAILDRTGS